MARRWAMTKSPPRAKRWAGRTSRSTCPPMIATPGASRACAAARRTRPGATGWIRSSAKPASFSAAWPATCRPHWSGAVAAEFNEAGRRTSKRCGDPGRFAESARRDQPVVPETIGGSADLTGSNNTKSEDMAGGQRRRLMPAQLHPLYGVREHGMAAAMNGMALHGGVIPYSAAHFLVFSDYSPAGHPLAALMGQRVIHVMTHDSIGLGEDGPTHQPVEHLAALAGDPQSPCLSAGRRRRKPLECWQSGDLEADTTPSVLALTRQGPCRRCARNSSANEMSVRTRRLRDAARAGAKADAEVAIFASGSEVEIAMEAAKRWNAAGHPARVVSVPVHGSVCRTAGAAYREDVVGTPGSRLASKLPSA